MSGSTTNAQCLFCRRALRAERGERNQEHVVPRSLGGDGWFTTYSLCRACNSYLGARVDVVADDWYFFGLRREAGLDPKRPVAGEFTHPGLRTRVRGRLRADGVIDEARRVYRQGDEIVISSPTTESVARIAEGIARARDGEGEEVAFGPAESVAEWDVPFIVRPEDSSDLAQFRERMIRLASKTAIEYIACIVSDEVALHPALDPVRHAARNGDRLAGADVRVVTPDVFWLPRSGELTLPRTAESPSDGEVDALMPRNADGGRDPAPDVPHLRELWHALQLRKDHEGARFELILFAAYLARVPVPAELDLPWERSDRIHLMRRSRLTIWP